MSNLNRLKEVDMLPLSNDYVFKRIFWKGGNERIFNRYDKILYHRITQV